MARGRMLDAWDIAKASGTPLERWHPGAALTQAAKLASVLGADRLSQALHWKNWRADRKDARRYFQSLSFRARCRTNEQLIDEIGFFLDANGGMTPEERADLLAYQAWLYASQRDFSHAMRLIDEAMGMQEPDSWLWVQRANLLEMSDQYDAALEAARRAVALDPLYRPAVLELADALVNLGRDDEALAVVADAHARSQQAAFAMRLQAYHSEREEHERALWCLDEIERLSPLMERGLRSWVCGRRADFLLLAGDLDGFETWAGRKHSKRPGFHQIALENLRKPGAREGRRVRLDVPFVRQHRSTCAPATLSTLAAYWGKAHDHLEIAEAICHEGTPWHKERRWANEAGFFTREFRLTRESLIALIDRGVPFTLTTQWPTGAHLQSCIGYDSRTDIAILRDSTERHFDEVLIEGLMKDHPVAGPRGMILLPPEEVGRIDCIELEDVHAYDALHDLLVAIDTHDRLKIEGALTGLRCVAPGHMLALDGEVRAAMAQDDWLRALPAVEAIAGRAPEHQIIWLTRTNLLHSLGRKAERRRLLELAVADRKCDPVFVSELGELLLEDVRDLERADYFLRRALRMRRSEERCYASLAACRMKQRRYEEVARLFRAASCLSPDFEYYATQHFDACRIVGRVEEGLEFLAGRTSRHGAKSHGPWVTHAEVLNNLERPRDAAAVLEAGVAARPDDGRMLLGAGRLMIGWGPEFRERALAWIAAARGRVPEYEWLGDAANVAFYLGKRREAIRHLRAAIALQPARIWAWRMLARLVAEEENRDAARRLLDEGTRRHPELANLWALQAEWLVGTERGPLDSLDHFLALEPKSRWGLRERALRRLKAGKEHHDAALADALEALALDPLEANSHHVHGMVLEDLGRKEEAAAAYRRCLELDVDMPTTADRWMDLTIEAGHPQKVIDFIEGQLDEQVSDGTMHRYFQTLAWRWIDPPVLLSKLERFCRRRPDAWQAWSALIHQAQRMGDLDRARKAAEKMTEHFPLMPRAWLELAGVHRVAGHDDLEAEATAKAMEISPSWDEAARLHADVLERLGRVSEAVAVLRQAVRYDPLNSANHGCLADLLRRQGSRDEAFDVLRAVLTDCPFYSWGWEKLGHWGWQDDRGDEVADALTQGEAANGQHHDWWSIAAASWAALGRTDDSISTLKRGIERYPDDMDLQDRLATQFVRMERFDDAMAACELPPGSKPARELEGRRAWILMKSGRPVEAIAAMRALIEREPDYLWGISEITEWFADRGMWKESGEFARRWARYAPQDHLAFGYIGQSCEKLEQEADAERAFRRAWALSPDYAYAGRRLIALQMRSGQLNDAAETLRRLEYFAPSNWVTCDGISLALHRKDVDGALKLAEQLLDTPSANFDALKAVDDAFTEASQQSAWRTRLERRLEERSVKAYCALSFWISLLSYTDAHKRGYRMVIRQPMDSDIRIEGWWWLLKRCIAHDQHVPVLKRWIRKHRAEFLKHGVLWSETGGALSTAGECQAAFDWLKDWRDRTNDVTTNTMIYLGTSSDGASRHRADWWQKSTAIREEALRRFPNHDCTDAYRAALAYHRAVDGETDSAREILSQFEPDFTSQYYQHLAALARAFVAMEDGDENAARDHFQRGNEGLMNLDGLGLGTRRLLDRGLRAMARRLPWARGSVGKLRKEWSLTKIEKPYWGGLVEDRQTSIAIWVALVILFIIAKILMRSDG